MIKPTDCGTPGVEQEVQAKKGNSFQHELFVSLKLLSFFFCFFFPDPKHVRGEVRAYAL